MKTALLQKSLKPPTYFIVSILLFFSLYTTASEGGITCSKAMKNTGILNSYDLWKGAEDCSNSNMKLETNYLLLIGQIRAMTDITVLEPTSDEEGLKASKLYGVLYYKTGGSGIEEVYRDSKSYESLIKHIETWAPIFNKAYNPSWVYKPNIDSVYYNKMAECQKAVRLSKLKWYSGLIQNDDYYELSKQLNQLSTDNSGTFKAGTEAHENYQALSKKLNAISSKLPIPSQNSEECSFIKPYKPAPDASFKQVLKGYNGPDKSSANLYISDVELTNSWIAKALKPADLDALLKQVDFNRQIVVSLSFGKRKTATGTIHISDIKYNTVYKSLSISGLIGVNKKGCTENRSNSFPFALAIADRPPTITQPPGLYVQNFPDGCKNTVSGSPVDST